ncbi:acyl-CoA dehydratase activase-related protein [Sporohalobacter salinus]|uniref:acyl-CoA dehydratase activase-related protein n=1 Tax=Sporohalobacter salinus TaxID=1494606 RepID=UPI00195F37F4|nr:acyl-CoA dehydratase activase-related protein [Sporohalobacter salinus]MBM7622868.1 putative nucleotide-binding protein (sugar kinase/HSP70/actin superfamily) [Sporohalobacter salinus]
MSVKIGIPKTLSYYVYYPLWHKFFTELGAEVVTSNNTSRYIVDGGVKETVNDACVPIKLFHGHVLNLKDRVDYLFLPRLVSTNGCQVYCPKFLGLPDMIRNTLDGLPKIIEPKVDLRKGKFEFIKLIYQAGSILTKNPFKIYSAFFKAKDYFNDFQSLLQQGYTVNEAIKELNGEEVKGNLSKTKDTLKVAVLGYPYIIYDPYVSVNMIKKLRDLDVEIVTSDMVSEEELAVQSSKLKKDLFWTLSDKKIKAGYHYYEKGEIDGLVHVSAFGCGPDFIVDKLLELKAKDKDDISFMTLTVDEHTGEAGIVTRLEAFIDMLHLRGRKQ